MPNPLIETLLDPSDADVEPVDRGLHDYNQRSADLTVIRRFVCRARNPDRTLAGGVLARWWGTACEVLQLWVDETSRRRGVGTALMSQVEETAIKHGCRLIYLDTFTFQAPQFYFKLGYETACRLDGFPDGGSKLILRKVLA